MSKGQLPLTRVFVERVSAVARDSIILKYALQRKKLKKIVSNKKSHSENYNENYIKLTGKAEKELIAGEGKGRQGP